MTLLAPRIGNEVSYVMRINDAIHLAWQGQYLVKRGVTPVVSRVGNDVSYVTRINHDIHFSVAGAVFGEVGG